MDKYMFIKMLYFADRESLARWGEPITGDHAVSMKYGPVLSIIYDLTKGDCPLYHGDWSQFISDADSETNRISLANDSTETDALCPAELEILKSVFEKFQNWTWKQMRDFSHDLAEYDKTVGNGARGIAIEGILRATGKNDEQIQDIAECNHQIRMAEMMFSGS